MILSALIDADSERQKVVASSQLKKKSFFVAEVALRLRRYFHFWRGKWFGMGQWGGWGGVEHSSARCNVRNQCKNAFIFYSRWGKHSCFFFVRLLHQVNMAEELDLAIKSYFSLAAANQRIRERYGNAVIDIQGHNTVLKPRETLQRLCDHLGVTCSEDYFEKCSSILFGVPSVTRDKVVWTKEQKEQVTKQIKNFSFLKEYSFDEYPK